ncbi:hypothetical protein DPX16_10719 [Anabarilius grahami]|uniref:Uncharacterized protein n=1 Tax=Anabarilius grahami TaxID=495550 RepID=A0A3N0Z766_ANAGA|nr:hypothetical protein DPX16_10719 [Anabarilius grahami]
MLAADHVTGLEILEKKSNKMAASQRQWSEEKERELISFYAEFKWVRYVFWSALTLEYDPLCDIVSLD